MQFIAEEQFLKAPEKVQRIFKEEYDHQEILYSFNGTVYYGEFFDKLGYTPLITEGQLRKFIKDNAYKISLMQYDDVEYTLTAYLHGLKKVEIDCIELLQAYWEVACMIAKESIK
jgi:hypothetical protein